MRVCVCVCNAYVYVCVGGCMYVCVYVYVGACIYVSVWVHCVYVCAHVYVPWVEVRRQLSGLSSCFLSCGFGNWMQVSSRRVKCHNPLSYLSSPKSICFVFKCVCVCVYVFVCVVVSCVLCRSRYNCWEPLLSFYLGFQRLNLGYRAWGQNHVLSEPSPHQFNRIKCIPSFLTMIEPVWYFNLRVYAGIPSSGFREPFVCVWVLMVNVFKTSGLLWV